MNNNKPELNDNLLFIDFQARGIHDLVFFLLDNPAGIETVWARDRLRVMQEHCGYIREMADYLIDEISEKEKKKYEEQNAFRSLRLVSEERSEK